ncbi:MAG TPA: ATP-binding cassette domain-containing protein, partial [Phycicoccus elongatus]|nr:ATP-binding cassette domain-containing protein [Phycicoccus elongatus]
MATHQVSREVVITVDDLKKAFGQNEVLKGITTSIHRGEVVCVIGPSGSGKSTFLRCLNLLEAPTSGKVVVDGVEVTDPDCDIDKVRADMGMVFQQFNLFPHLSVLDNCTIAQLTVRKSNKADAEKRARSNLERVGLLDKEGAYPGQLSGGQ